MFWLPKLAVGAAQWRLPLSESTAAAIVAVLFSVEGDGSRELFRRTVETDPGLALWLACSSPRDHIPRGVDDLAEWFLADAAIQLVWDTDIDEAVSPDQWDPGNWSELAERSRYVARRSVQLTCESRQANRAELIGLLHLSPELLALCGPAVRLAAGEDKPNCLPDWLSTAIGQLRRAESSDGCHECVGQAVAELESHRPAGKAPAGERSTLSLAAMLPRISRSLARLATLENEFAASLESAKLDAMRELAYGASHEINNPLANISTRAQTLLVGETDPERRRKLATINSQAFRAHEMISDIMLFAKPPRIDPIPVDLAELTGEILSELADDAAEQGTELRCELQHHQLSVLADRGHLAIALKALVRNSLEAIGMGGHIELTARLIAAESSSGSQVEIVVRDTGPGVSTESRNSIFNPFYSGREAGRGLGLGLSKCWRIITLHGGSISLDDTHSDGARFVICLPVGAVHSVDPEFAAHG